MTVKEQKKKLLKMYLETHYSRYFLTGLILNTLVQTSTDKFHLIAVTGVNASSYFPFLSTTKS